MIRRSKLLTGKYVEAAVGEHGVALEESCPDLMALIERLETAGECVQGVYCIEALGVEFSIRLRRDDLDARPVEDGREWLYQLTARIEGYVPLVAGKLEEILGRPFRAE